MSTLRPYQLEMVERVRSEWMLGHRKMLLALATGGGKTICGAQLITNAVAKGGTALFFAHRREIINQTYKKLIGCSCRTGFTHDEQLARDPQCANDGLPFMQVGVIMATDKRRRPPAPIQVASVDTFRNIDPKRRPPATLVIFDEAHRSLAKSYLDIAAAYPDALLVGLSATPYRADGRGLGDLYTTIVTVVQPRQLIEQGYLCQVRVFAPKTELPDLNGIPMKGKDYDEQILADTFDQSKLTGNIVEHWKELADNRRTVVFAINVKHSQHIAREFQDAGIAAEHLDGETPTLERDAILARLERGETRVVSNCNVLSEGWDMPCVKVLVLARPTKSCGMHLQQAGRVMRPWNGETALILDHSGNSLHHGRPDEDREYSLDGRPKKAGGARAKTCPDCFAILASATALCPCCGHVFAAAPREEMEHVDGKLVELKAATASEQRACWDDLCETARRKGYKPGWASYRFKEKYHRFPPRHFPKLETQALPPMTTLDIERLQMRLESEAIEKGYSAAWVAVRLAVAQGKRPNAALEAAATIVKPPTPYPVESVREEWAV